MNKLLITSAVAFALSISGCGEQKTAEQLLASAGQYSQQGKFANAIIDYKNAIRLSPKDADARLGLGNSYLHLGNYISAEKELDRAVELGAIFSQTAPLLAQVKTRLDKFSEVEALVKASEDLKDSDYLVILTFAGMSALSDGQLTKAQDYLSQAAAMNAEADFSKLAGAYLLYSERKFTQGLTSIDALLATSENFAEARLLQGYLHFSLKDFEQASHAFDSYISLYPQDFNVQFFQANTLIKAKKFEQANTLTDKILKRFKKSPLALQYKSQISYQAEKYLEAREFASQAIGYDEGFVIAKMIAGVSSYKLNDLEQAYDYLIGLEDMLPATHPINVILLSIKIKLGHTDDLTQSVAKLNALKDSDSDTDLLQITSLELMKIGDYTNAQSLLNKAEKVSPNNASIKVQRGALLLSQRDLSGIKSLEQALTIDPSLHETEFALARQYIQGNELIKAQAIASKWLSSEEYLVSGNVLSGMIASKQENETAAEAFFKKALALEGNNISALYSLAAVYDYKKRTEDAIAGYEKVITLNPNHHNAISRYSALQESQGNIPLAISFLSGIYDQSQLNSGISHKNLVIGLAQVLSISGQMDTSIDLLETIKREQNLSERYWSVLAETYTMNGQHTHALTTYEEAVKIKPTSYILRVGYIGALDKLKKYQRALVLALQSNKDFPNDDNLSTTVAYLEFVNNNVKEAKKQIQALKERGVSNFLVDITEANLAMAEKDYEHATILYKEIYTKTPSGQNAVNLARSLEFSNQGAVAEKTLENYLSKNSDDNQVRILLADLYSKHNTDGGKSAQIIAAYQAALKVQPNRLDVLNNLAWQQYLINDLDKALNNIELATVIDSNNLSVQESYGVILVANKDYQKAIKVLTRALKNGSVDVNAKVSLAEAYIANKQGALAKEILLGLSAHDSDLNIKIALLKQLVE